MPIRSPSLPSRSPSCTTLSRLALNCLGVAAGAEPGRPCNGGLRVSEHGSIFGLAPVSNSGYLRARVSTIRLMIPNALSAGDSPPLRHVLPRNLGNPPSSLCTDAMRAALSTKDLMSLSTTIAPFQMDSTRRDRSRSIRAPDTLSNHPRKQRGH